MSARGAEAAARTPERTHSASETGTNRANPDSPMRALYHPLRRPRGLECCAYLTTVASTIAHRTAREARFRGHAAMTHATLS
jgi:hypothetical protein